MAGATGGGLNDGDGRGGCSLVGAIGGVVGGLDGGGEGMDGGFGGDGGG
jgi:hypothetical protein